MSETIFVLGAGASQEAGCPLMNNFLNVVDGLWNKAGTFKEDFQLVNAAIDALSSVHSKAQLDLNNLEEVFGAFEMARMIGLFPGIEEADIPRLLPAFQRVIMYTLEQTTCFKFENGRVHPPEAQYRFAELVADLSRRQRCSIITFNYDVGLDYALGFQGVPYDYCLATKEWVRTPLLKLHGSLNWFQILDSLEVFALRPEEFVGSVSTLCLNDGSMVFVPIGSAVLRCHREPLRHLGAAPLIVPPTWNKTTHQDKLQCIWKRAAQELSDAENVFICGYSLAAADAYFKYLFALGAAGKTRIRRFIVFDPDQSGKVYGRYKALLGPGADLEYKHFMLSGMVKFLHDKLLSTGS
jgi:hypothetical protein